MPRALHLAIALCLTISAAAQQIDDPANLMGERVSPPALADTLPIDRGAPALEQLLRKLRTRASLMLIVAHPDDEDSGMLTYESRGMGARVAMLTLTRGEGGQNLMSADFNDALGLIRTQELLGEDRYTGTDQFFGTEVDFGFSKTKEESFAKWGHDRVLYDAVRAVRLYRPLVLASVFIGEPTDGHGQHQVSGEIAQEVFLAAADPKVFPEMGLPPWAPLKVFGRVPFARITGEGMFDYATGKYLPPRFQNYVTGAVTSTPPSATVTIHEGDKPNILAFDGMSYIQWARQGLALQKSQIGPSFHGPMAGVYDSGYTLYGTRIGPSGTLKPSCAKSATAQPELSWAQAVRPCPNYAPPSTAEPDLFTGIDTTFPGIADLAPSAPAKLHAVLGVIDLETAEAQKLFDPAHPELTAPPLTRALKLLDDLIRDTEVSSLPQSEKFNLLHELRVKRVQFNNALVLAIGISLEARIPGSIKPDLLTTAWRPKYLEFTLHTTGAEEVKLEQVSLVGDGTAKRRQVVSTFPRGGNGTLSDGLPISESAVKYPTRPYFSRSGAETPFYDIHVPALRNAPSTPPPLVASAIIEVQGAKAEVQTVVPDPRTIVLRPVSNESVTKPGAPRLQQDAVIVPSVSLSISPTVAAVPAGTVSLVLTTQVKAEASVQQLGGVMLFRGDKTIEKAAPEENSKVIGQDEYVSFRINPNDLGTQPSVVRAAVTEGHHDYSEGYRPVGYPGIPYTNYYTPATAKIVPVDVTTAPNLHIAYLPGTGDEVAQFLPSLGVTPTILTAKDLTLENLKQYDAILLGVRAYSAHPELEGAGSDALNAYAKQGGVVIVQYSSAGFNPASAPFPYTIPGDSAHNVVDETAPVTLLQPANPLLTWPNRITPADFNGWIEERGHGFATDWSPEYTPLLEMHDPEQDPQKGGLLVAKTGRGAYLYCALALYRQLPEGVPGAYRLIANLLSYAKNPRR